MTFISITWKSGDAKDFSDIFEHDAIREAAEGDQMIHWVIGPHGGVYSARARISIRPRVITLDYNDEAYRFYNQRRGMELGTMELHLSGSKMNPSLKSVSWNNVPQSSEDCTIKFLKSISSLMDIRSGKHSQIVIGQSVRRPVQARLRQAIDRIYNERCAISRCSVVDVLEVAHIIPFSIISSERIANLLLLRADLHCLLDAG